MPGCKISRMILPWLLLLLVPDDIFNLAGIGHCSTSLPSTDHVHGRSVMGGAAPSCLAGIMRGRRNAIAEPSVRFSLKLMRFEAFAADRQCVTNR